MKNKKLFLYLLITIVIFIFQIKLFAFTENRGASSRKGYADIQIKPDEIVNIFDLNISEPGINKSQPVTDGVFAYVGINEGRVIKINLKTGVVCPDFVQTQGPIISTGLLKEGILYIGSTDGNMYVIDANTMAVVNIF